MSWVWISHMISDRNSKIPVGSHMAICIEIIWMLNTISDDCIRLHLSAVVPFSSIWIGDYTICDNSVWLPGRGWIYHIIHCGQSRCDLDNCDVILMVTIIHSYPGLPVLFAILVPIGSIFDTKITIPNAWRAAKRNTNEQISSTVYLIIGNSQHNNFE